MMNEYVSPEELAEVLPVNSGDSVLIASDMVMLAYNALMNNKSFDFGRLIDLLKEKAGHEGNILFPTYNWDFCKGIAWNYKTTPSRTGSLSQIALNRPDFIRTRHPIYSFAVWGRDSERLFMMNDDNSFTGDTPFTFLHHTHNSKMLTIDVNLSHCFTFVHYVEESICVPYRFLKKFTAGYIGYDGEEFTRTCSMYVRYLDRKVENDASGLEKILLEEAIMRKDTVKDITVRTVSFSDAYNIVSNDLKREVYSNIVRLG